MKDRLGLCIIVILLVSLLLPASVGAYYSNVIGELRDSKLNDPWQYGAFVRVYNCSTLADINTQTLLAGDADFDIDISSVTEDTLLCIQVDFNPGPNGDPNDAYKGPYGDTASSSGTLDAGTFLTGTGPTTVDLASFAAQSGNRWVPLMLVLIWSVVAAGVVYTLRQFRI